MPPKPEPPRTILLMRHGETAWNRERRVMGNADVELNAAGRQQCARVAAVLAGFSIDRIISSPLRRALESAQILADKLEVSIEADSDLEEVHFGRWQGQTYEEIVADPQYHAFLEDPSSNGTPGGETIVDVQRRGLAAFARAGAGERTLYVSHGDIIRTAICHFMAIPVNEFRRIRVDNCGLSAFASVGGRYETKFINTLADPERAWDPLHWGGAT